MTHENQVCIISECTNLLHSRGLCSTHYSRMRNGVDMYKPIQKYKDNGQPSIQVSGKEKRYKQRYGLSLTDLRELYDSQGGCCALCFEPCDLDKMQVDHNHSCCPGIYTCGKCLRGLLCKGCNLGLGHFKDDVAKLKLAIDYLTKV